MAYLAIAYPNISELDFDWIQSIRQKNDRQFNLVKPHITLIFGTDKLSLNEFTNHVQNSLHTSKSFQISLDTAQVVEDSSSNYFHALLIPSVGFNEINELHNLLYKDALESELRPNIPFIPHLTIGSGSKEEMAALVDKINEQQISIKGNVDKISIISFDGATVKDITEVPLLIAPVTSTG